MGKWLCKIGIHDKGRWIHLGNIGRPLVQWTCLRCGHIDVKEL